MNIAIVAPKTDTDSWEKQFNTFSKDINLHIWPDIKDYDIIDRLKSNNTFQFANFVDVSKIKDRYYLSL